LELKFNNENFSQPQKLTEKNGVDTKCYFSEYENVDPAVTGGHIVSHISDTWFVTMRFVAHVLSRTTNSK